MLIPSHSQATCCYTTSLSRRVNANSQHSGGHDEGHAKLIKKGEC